MSSRLYTPNTYRSWKKLPFLELRELPFLSRRLPPFVVWILSNSSWTRSFRVWWTTRRRFLETAWTSANRWFNRNIVILGLTFGAVVILLDYNFCLLTRESSHTREMERAQLENIRSSRALSARILDQQDAERRRVARELHDSVGQYLVGLKINLERLQSDGATLNAGHAKLMAETIDLTNRSVAEVRTISHLLHPPLLEEVGLESAARWYTDGFAKRCGLRVSL